MKTITVATARKIAKDHGLTFTYSRSANVYVLSNPASNKISFMPKVLTLARYDKKDLDSVTVDDFYLVCMNVAANTISKEQMDKVVARARYMALQDYCASNPGVIIPGYMEVSANAYSNDKIVHNMENAIYGMREELDLHGCYADHKALFAVTAIETPYQVIVNTIRSVTKAAPGSDVGAMLVSDFESSVGYYYVMTNGVSTHRLLVDETTEERLMAHWTGFISNLSAKVAYRDMPLNEVMARQRDRLVSRMVSYIERGEYSAMVTKETGTQGVYWFIAIRKGSEVLNTDIHYSGPELASNRALALLDSVAPVAVNGTKDVEVNGVVFSVEALSDGSHKASFMGKWLRVRTGGVVYTNVQNPALYSDMLKAVCLTTYAPGIIYKGGI